MKLERLAPVTFALLLAGPAQAGEWMVPNTARDLKNPVADTPQNAARGAKLYVDHCRRCHGPAGAGDGGEARVEYDLRELIKPLTDGAVYWKITHGVGRMPSHAGSLTDHERWLSVNHLRALARERDAAAKPAPGAPRRGAPAQGQPKKD